MRWTSKPASTRDSFIMANTDRLMKGSKRQLAPTATAPALEGGGCGGSGGEGDVKEVEQCSAVGRGTMGMLF